MNEQEQILLENIKSASFKLMSGCHGHESDHLVRVARIAEKICAAESDADVFIVLAAVYLHDADDYKFFDQETAENLKNSRKIMTDADVPAETMQRILDILNSIGYSKRLAGTAPDSIEGKIVSDADLLEAAGAVGIIRSHTYNIKHGTNFFDAESMPLPDMNSQEYASTITSAVNNIIEKSLRLRPLLFTNYAIQEFSLRFTTMVNFLRDFFREQDLPAWSSYLDNYISEHT